MSNQISNGSGLLWKPGTRNTAVEFANCKKLRSQEPDTFALLTLQDHFKTSDERFEYTVYSSRFGFSVGRKKKPVFIPDPDPNTKPNVNVKQDLPQPQQQTPQTDRIAIDATTTAIKEDQFISALHILTGGLENHVKRLEELTESINALVSGLAASSELERNAVRAMVGGE